MDQGCQAGGSEAGVAAGTPALPAVSPGLPAALVADIERLSALERSLRQMLSETTQELRRLAGLLEIPLPAATPAQSATHPDLERLLGELREAIGGLQHQVRDLDARCAAVTELAAANCARIEEILRSRVWRALTALGGLLLRLLRR